MKDYVVIDIETTGLNPRYDEIIELAAVRFSDFRADKSFVSLIKPTIPVNPGASRVNGITDAMLASCPGIEKVFPDFMDFIGDSKVLVGHNIIGFDLKFLCAASKHFDPRKFKIYDTMIMARRILRPNEVRNYKLGTLCDHYNIKHRNAHRAEGDCVATGELFAALVNRAGMER